MLKTRSPATNACNYLPCAYFLRACTHIHSLNLASNYIGMLSHKCDGINNVVTSAIRLAKAIEENESLSYLNLSSNSLKNLPAQHIGESLHNNHYVETLDLSYNGITESGCSVLASALKVNETLTNLILDGNGPGRVGGKALMVALSSLGTHRAYTYISCSCSTVR